MSTFFSTEFTELDTELLLLLLLLLLKSCPTLCNPVDCSLPGFSVRGILQARTLAWCGLPFPSPMHESGK